jgi:hypothetical protein
MKFFGDDDDGDEPKKERKPSWPAIRDLFSTIIAPANGWQDASLIADEDEMRTHFYNAFPDVTLWFDDIRLALHALDIPYERNEHNNKWYYLARWK